MIIKEVVIKGDAGVHARPAMMMVREAMKYGGCSVTLVKDDVEADCKSIMSVIGLAMVAGSSVTIKADGDGEAEIVEKLAAMVESNFTANQL